MYSDSVVHSPLLAPIGWAHSYGIRQSMSHKGAPYNNAVAENFFSCLKCELIHLKHYCFFPVFSCPFFREGLKL